MSVAATCTCACCDRRAWPSVPAQLATALMTNTSLRRIQYKSLELKSGMKSLSLLKMRSLNGGDAALIAAASTTPLLNSLERVTLDGGASLPVKQLNGSQKTADVDLSNMKLGVNAAVLVWCAHAACQRPRYAHAHAHARARTAYEAQLRPREREGSSI